MYLSLEQKVHLNTILDHKDGCLCVFGSAGTGKSTLLNALKIAEKDLVVLTPTGLSSILVGGSTIHSFFAIKPDGTRFKMRSNAKKALKTAKYIVFDEASMIRVDLIERVSEIMQEVLKNNLPFGGKALVFFGDLAQLEPVLKDEESKYILKTYDSHFFFDSPSLKQLPLEIIKLETIYRQQGEVEFIEALQALRIGNPDKLDVFNKRIDVPDDECLRITYTNKRCSLINEAKLKQLNSQQYCSTAEVEGDFHVTEYPVDEKVYFKLGARVMLLKNNKEMGNDYVNGDIGTITKIIPGKVYVQLDRNRQIVYVEKHTWEKTAYTSDGAHVDTEVVGTFTQIPLRLAWSLTTHKCQGQTFHNKVHVELEIDSFAHGLLYVALSRATKLDNLTIGRRIYADDIIIDKRVFDWCEQYGL